MPEERTDPERIIQGYPWPSSQLTKADMIRLSDLRERVGKPITKLIHDAVKAYYFLIVDAPKAGEQCCENPRLRWEGERGSAAIICDGCGFVLADDGQLEDWHDPDQIADEAFLKAEEDAIIRHVIDRITLE